MASKLLENAVHHMNNGPQGLVILTGKAVLASGSQSVVGKGFASISSPSTGEYTVTLGSKWVKAHAILVSAKDDSNALVAATVSDDSIASAGTFKFQLFEAGVAADATKAEEVHFVLFLDNSSKN